MVHVSIVDYTIPKLLLPVGDEARISRAVATLLNYPRGTRIQDRSFRPWPESTYPVIEICSPELIADADLVLEFPNQNCSYMYTTTSMKRNSPEQYRLLIQSIDNFTESLNETMLNPKSIPPRYLQDIDFFDETVSRRISRRDRFLPDRYMETAF